jgi:hypothetical protein
VTDLLDVSPASVRDGAFSCRVVGDRAQALGHVLEQAVAGRWASPAGAAFADRVAEHLSFVRGAADRLLATSGILLRFADALEQAQQRYLIAQDACSLAEGYAEQYRLVLRTTRLTDAVAAALHRERLDWEERTTREHSTMTAVAAEWEHVEARFAAELRAVADDGIRDDGCYRFLHSAQRWADRGAVLGLVPGPQQLVTVPASAFAATASTGLSVGFRVGYGEGSWKQLGADIALNRLRTAAKVLKYGATALPRNGLAPERLSTLDRLGVGARSTARESWLGRRVPSPSGGTAKVVNPPATGPLLQRSWVTARGKAVAQLDARYRADFRVATGNGQEAKRMLVQSWALDTAARTWVGADKVVTAQDVLRGRGEERAESRRGG